MSTEYESEAKLSNDLSLAFTGLIGLGSRIFRNNVGLGWSGTLKHRATKRINITLQPGDVVLSNPRPVKFGLCEGSSDKIGWTQVVITDDMVGKKIAVFTAIEEKSATGRLKTTQRNFIHTVKSCGGIAAMVKSLDDLTAAINSYRPL